MSNIIKSIYASIIHSNDAHKMMYYRKKLNRSQNIFTTRVYIFLINRLNFRNNAYIPVSCKIGNDVIFPHGLSGIYISDNGIIGNNCTIFQQVTIGNNSLPSSKKFGSPIIGNNVYIGAGAKIIGKIEVGDNVRIGANAIVVENIPNNSTVVSAKAIVIPRSYSKNIIF